MDEKVVLDPDRSAGQNKSYAPEAAFVLNDAMDEEVVLDPARSAGQNKQIRQRHVCFMPWMKK